MTADRPVTEPRTEAWIAFIEGEDAWADRPEDIIGVFSSEQSAWNGIAQWVAESGENRDWRQWAMQSAGILAIEAETAQGAAPQPHGPNDGCGEMLWEHMSAEPGFDEEIRQAQAEIAEGRGVTFLAAPRAKGLERDRILEALRDEQQYAGALSDALLRLGHHPFGHHESPTSYDADSPRACSFTQCLARLSRPSDERVPE